MHSRWKLLLGVALLTLLFSGCPGKKRELAGTWSMMPHEIMGQKAGASVVLNPDGTMVMYYRLEFDDQPAALDIHGTWKADEDKQILTIEKTETRWNGEPMEVKDVLGTESGNYTWRGDAIEWEREISGRKVTVTLNRTGPPPQSAK